MNDSLLANKETFDIKSFWKFVIFFCYYSQKLGTNFDLHLDMAHDQWYWILEQEGPKYHLLAIEALPDLF